MGQPDVDPTAAAGHYVAPARLERADRRPGRGRDRHPQRLRGRRSAPSRAPSTPAPRSFRDFPAWWQEQRASLRRASASRCSAPAASAARNRPNYLLGQGVDEVYHLQGRHPEIPRGGARRRQPLAGRVLRLRPARQPDPRPGAGSPRPVPRLPPPPRPGGPRPAPVRGRRQLPPLRERLHGRRPRPLPRTPAAVREDGAQLALVFGREISRGPGAEPPV